MNAKISTVNVLSIFTPILTQTDHAVYFTEDTLYDWIINIMMPYFTSPHSVTASLFITKYYEAFIFLKILTLISIGDPGKRQISIISGSWLKLKNRFLWKGMDFALKIVSCDSKEKVGNLFGVLVKITTFCLRWWFIAFCFSYLWIWV